MTKSIYKTILATIISLTLLLSVTDYGLFLPSSVAYAADDTIHPMPDGIVGTAYTYNITDAFGLENVTYSLVGCYLPFGLELNENGIISGTPLIHCICNVQIIAVDIDNVEQTSTATFSLNITHVAENASLVQSVKRTEKQYNNDGTIAYEIQDENYEYNYYDSNGLLFSSDNYSIDLESNKKSLNFREMYYDSNGNNIKHYYAAVRNGLLMSRSFRITEYNEDNSFSKVIMENNFMSGSTLHANKNTSHYTYTDNSTLVTTTNEMFDPISNTFVQQSYREETTRVAENGDERTEAFDYSNDTKSVLRQKGIYAKTESSETIENWNSYAYTKEVYTKISETLEYICSYIDDDIVDWHNPDTIIEPVINESSYNETLIIEKNALVKQERKYDETGTPKSFLTVSEITADNSDRSTSIVRKEYRNDLLESNSTIVTLPSIFTFNDTETLNLFFSTKKLENIFYNNKNVTIKVKDGVDCVITDSIVIPQNTDVILGNLTLTEGAEIKLSDKSSLKINGNLICGTTTIGSALTYDKDNVIKGTIEQPTVISPEPESKYEFPVYAIVLICVLGVALIYLLGLLLFKFKVIKGKFFSCIYAYVLFEKIDTQDSQELQIEDEQEPTDDGKTESEQEPTDDGEIKE